MKLGSSFLFLQEQIKDIIILSRALSLSRARSRALSLSVCLPPFAEGTLRITTGALVPVARGLLIQPKRFQSLLLTRPRCSDQGDKLGSRWGGQSEAKRNAAGAQEVRAQLTMRSRCKGCGGICQHTRKRTQTAGSPASASITA